jgi:hypothetical protein
MGCTCQPLAKEERRRKTSLILGPYIYFPPDILLVILFINEGRGEEF